VVPERVIAFFAIVGVLGAKAVTFVNEAAR